MDNKWTTELIVNGEWQYVEKFTIEQINEIQRLFKKFIKQNKED